MANEAQFLAAVGAPVTGRSRYQTAGPTAAYASTGTNTATVAGTVYLAEIEISRNAPLVGIAVLNGATVGTDKGIVSLYDSNGNLVANSALAGATTSGANAYQTYAFTAPYNAVGPARYWIGYQSNGTTDTIRTIAASSIIMTLTGSATGVFGTLPAITPPVAFAADKGPYAYAYVV